MRNQAPKYAITGHSGNRSMGYDLIYNKTEMKIKIWQWKEDGATEIYVLPVRADHSYSPPAYVADADRDPVYYWRKE